MQFEDPNTLTYKLIECATGQVIEAKFVPLQIADQKEIEGPSWGGVFTALWKQIVETEVLRNRALKIVCDGSDLRIQGLLFLGDGHDREWSLDCLLETAPWNRYGMTD